MNFDRLLRRFRIQTKVLIFICPFVISIAAVGVTGLYVSGLLQGQMDTSDKLLQSLSGFREVSADMEAFLQQATVENREAVVQKLSDQHDMLFAMQADVGAGDRQQLQEAMAAVQRVSSQIGDLWTLHQTEVSLEQQLQAGLVSLSKKQADLSRATSQIQGDIAERQRGSMKKLRASEQLDASLAMIDGLATQYTKADDAAKKQAVIREHVTELRALERLVRDGLADGNKPRVDAFSATVDRIVQAAGDRPLVDQEESRLGGDVVSLRQFKFQFSVAASRKVKESTQELSKLNDSIVKVNGLSAYSRKLINSGYDIQIMLAKFILSPSDENLETVIRDLENARKNTIDLAIGTSSRLIADRMNVKDEIIPILNDIEANSRQFAMISSKRHRDFNSASAEIDTIWKQLNAFADTQKLSAGQERLKANGISVSASLIGVLIAVFAGIGLVMTFKGPILLITSAMRKLADGKLDTAIAGEDRVDELGEMARALGVFKQNAVAKIEIEHQSEMERASAEEMRRRNDEEKQRIASQIDFAVAALASGLGRLSRGDISEFIDTPFDDRLEQLRSDFNASLGQLQQVMEEIRNNSLSIQGNAAEMSKSADELSKRTEQQAAALEQTAAAVDQITTTVRSSAERAAEANRIVVETKRSADASFMVVERAISAMGRIENASSEIVQIIDVIDEIAFQTNLLALNAGIEAARAGEAGKGFAVVAQEVRDLAQRSADAASEIKSLINRSSEEVSSGSHLVKQTGMVLAEISSKIVTVSEQVGQIAIAAGDQSSALGEVNSAVNEMDLMTQRNAAMVEQTSAATRHLANEADNLLVLIGQFKIAERTKSNRSGRDAA
ncbi:hypothetical protein B7W89_24625 [Agrobacterium tumefaciens]|uniref:methyl-accepting chemotaxis protein n=1 Tax=Agrobacterium tumefaciens TaxID=358 RepID=UPI000B3FC18B|nr:HAMP domain-containing protein [Agrobacterium tumefaciens]OVE86876.1 hypothetical protein B7W89_24625 [Agrobacterium tumefaciens]